tara:strand:- start:598 stop:837 length:240 start_codon:yes stop_codon:yes gene_type:complete
MNFKRLIHTDIGRIIISILLGLGLATLFRKVCNDRSCMIFKAPQLKKIKGQIFKYGKKCYKFNEEIENCNNNKKIVQFA